MPRWSNGCTGPTGRCRSATRSTPARWSARSTTRAPSNGCRRRWSARAPTAARSPAANGSTEGVPEGGVYVRPAGRGNAGPDGESCARRTFAPILYVLKYREFDQALALHNGVPQGLSSAIYTTDLRESELFLSAAGSDAGIANVNIGPSGAEIGGAFGGEKETGGGRESGSDAWKAYMRRQTQTVNYGRELPLAQGG